jgi:hypothetical protein
LTPEQKIKTEVLFKKMQARAISLGNELVEEERALDRLFASRAVNSDAWDKPSLALDGCKAKCARCT